MTRDRIVLLDLEECLIDSWSDRNTLHYNIEKIKESGILTPDPTVTSTIRVGLMSWAVTDPEDAEDFNVNLRHPLEEVLGIKFNTMLPMSMYDYAADVYTARRLKISIEDMYDLYRKEEVLLTLTRYLPAFRGKEIVLIDDAVDHNLTFTVNTHFLPNKKEQAPVDSVVRFINIDQPVDSWQFDKHPD